MQRETWQQLLSFESRDLVSIWFAHIHGRELNARRAKEITAAAMQAREFFRNSDLAAVSVKPLLTFYGVASLARALTLLLKREGGEESLAKGHGLETIDWSNQLSGDLSVGLARLNGLKIRTCAGLFSHFLNQTKNRISIHVSSSAVDWRIKYPQPSLSDDITFEELINRIPDLRKEHKTLGINPMYAAVSEIKYDQTNGFFLRAPSSSFRYFSKLYSDAGYEIGESGDWTTMTAGHEVFNRNTPQFLHAYIHKTFGAIPDLFLISPLPNGNKYSQLSITYMVAYVLGMLARYYPTHWVSLSQGSKGDALWPTINRAQRAAEETFPELVAEMIEDVLANPL
jgi:hypothetical protein